MGCNYYSLEIKYSILYSSKVKALWKIKHSFSPLDVYVLMLTNKADLDIKAETLCARIVLCYKHSDAVMIASRPNKCVREDELIHIFSRLLLVSAILLTIKIFFFNKTLIYIDSSMLKPRSIMFSNKQRRIS